MPSFHSFADKCFPTFVTSYSLLFNPSATICFFTLITNFKKEFRFSSTAILKGISLSTLIERTDLTKLSQLGLGREVIVHLYPLWQCKFYPLFFNSSHFINKSCLKSRDPLICCVDRMRALFFQKLPELIVFLNPPFQIYYVKFYFLHLKSKIINRLYICDYIQTYVITKKDTVIDSNATNRDSFNK